MNLAPAAPPRGAEPALARQRGVALPLALLALWLLATAAWRPLLLPDEGRYANVAREMLQGDLLVPTLNGLPFFHKPPLAYWIDAAAMALLGPTPFAARLAPALGAWLMGAALFLALRRWHGGRAATLGLVAIATTPLFFIGGQYVNHDMLVAGWITVAVFCFVRAVDEPTPALGWLVAGWAACALALLSKGLIGIVLPATVIAPWLVLQRRFGTLLRLLHPLGLLAFALIGLPWFIAMQLRYPGFFDYFIVEQHVRRFALANFNNARPVWFFVVLLPLLTLPWSVHAFAAAMRAWRARAALRGAPMLQLYAWWTIAIVSFFSLPRSKLIGYVLPALAPWCALIALAAVRARGLRLMAAAAALLCLGLVGGLAWKAPHSHRAAALTLAAERGAGERVVFVDAMFYDLPFYARLAEPPAIASDWDAPDLPQHDNWRKEVFDAARFDPARARVLLWPIARLAELRCGVPAVWFVVPPDQAWRLRELAGSERRYGNAEGELWRAPGQACS